MKKRKIRIRKIKDVPKKYIQHLHPSLRSIVEQTVVFFSHTRRWKIRRAECLRIRNRILYYRPHARVFPWYCETCTLSSRFLSVIQDHSCPNKNLSRHVQDFTNEQRIALLGFRSKAKDALAVMERVANPQAVDLGRVRFPEDDGGSASSATHNVVPRLRQAYIWLVSYLFNTDVVCVTVRPIIFSDLCLAVLSPLGKPLPAPTNEQRKIPCSSEPSISRYRPTKRTGQLCTVCHKLFPSFRDYEDHLRNESCPNDITPDPVPIQMSDSGTIPLNYVYSPKRKQATKSRLMICSLCHEDRFSTAQQFHEHIIECANKLAAL
ncbi:hypothetical protein ANCCAN_20373 [Ancylostoma caninum]|uniref:Uncharacterized protein n=1 Tax=Ancylostoma caninum TaxID=29170 RepID=A0A368FNH3_ANCCA|nr:hypothetical protein ANCCAN_20373 [Ancylostoma caninum]